MKVKPRNTVSRVAAKRITAPEHRIHEKTGKKIAMLSYLDGRSNQRHDDTTLDLFLYAAGTNEEGEVPDGLDRLADHQFAVHHNENGKAIGLDIVPARLYRSSVIPTSQVDVKTLVVQYDLDGAVARVIQRPFNTRPAQSMAVIAELDKLISAGKSIHSGMRLGKIGRIQGTTDNSVEIRLLAGTRTVQGVAEDDLEDTIEAPDEPVEETV